ncbi:hypothetical protein H9Y04_35160 [Streptomyces sp. TRM66268-LWL]|uniref:Uncharacterized protein n=1 Tax=Streptomyces polyasparticus TaxID=2767826 RepID=A0ABR7SQW8_9ACTN|nr:hypothetical protein [Streptomyces polyasparticus]MBC9717783.1 hypothetical protein [Streptomyces polyasparticus]
MPTRDRAKKDGKTVELSAFSVFAAETVEKLGEGWIVDTENTSGPVAFLTHLSGHRVGIRYLWRGQAVQTWATGVPPREYKTEADAKVMAENGAHLTDGSRYSVGVAFTHNSPAATTARNIRTRLLPAYGGKRPVLRAFPKKRVRPAAKSASSNDPKAAKPTAKATPTARAGRKKTDPATSRATSSAESRRSKTPRAERGATTTKPKDTPTTDAS